jgi:hypothetical protein
MKTQEDYISERVTAGSAALDSYGPADWRQRVTESLESHGFCAPVDQGVGSGNYDPSYMGALAAEWTRRLAPA